VIFSARCVCVLTFSASFTASTAKVQQSKRLWSSLWTFIFVAAKQSLHQSIWLKKIWDTSATSLADKNAGCERFVAASDWYVGWSRTKHYWWYHWPAVHHLQGCVWAKGGQISQNIVNRNKLSFNLLLNILFVSYYC